ncbi:hypothetical protein RISK_001971 [Rhodopirellula islandica]|uniref:Uncharacterized protein n=1 Tax=Rhodopirellula islandica TaxID=595434 RepID=A0A0J1BHU6_RHOIS|nr:hypothetical protein RISK_001971 [Rhodopirellula islandica]
MKSLRGSLGLVRLFRNYRMFAGSCADNSAWNGLFVRG